MVARKLAALPWVVARLRRVPMHVGAAVHHRYPWRSSARRPAAFLAGAAIVAALLPATLSASSSAAANSALVDPAINHVRGTVGIIVQAGDNAVQAAES